MKWAGKVAEERLFLEGKNQILPLNQNKKKPATTGGLKERIKHEF